MQFSPRMCCKGLRRPAVDDIPCRIVCDNHGSKLPFATSVADRESGRSPAVEYVVIDFIADTVTQPPEGFPADIEFGTYLHVLGVVVLAEPVDRFSDVPSGEAAPAFGVREIAQLPEPEEEAVEEPFM